jgi:acetylornithine deacetylase/succinyl-diaminopimelate desuccinylase-like protein
VSARAADLAGIHSRPAELLQNLIRFDTTNPPGNESACISYIQSLIADVGVESTIRAREPERPNLIARLRGRGAAAPLLLQGHVDVVSTAGQSWTHPPFEAVEAEGCIWGRGAVDMKGGVAMMLSAFLRAAAEGLEPPGDVIFCALADEEAMSGYGAEWLVREHAELFDGVRFAIGEFGGFTSHVAGRRLYPIQVAEKQVCTVRMTVRGQPGHGSLPVHGGAMARMAEALRRLDRRRLPVHVTPVVRDMVDAMAAALTRPQAAVLRLLLRPRTTNAVLDRIGDRARMLDPLLHNTVSPTVVDCDDKFNVIPAQVTAILDGRLLPGFTPDDLLAELRAILGEEVELEVVRFDPGPPEPDMGLFPTLAAILERADAGAAATPLLMPGVSDARFFARLGIQTYGFLPMKLPPGFDFWSGVHGSDERIPTGAVAFGADAVHQALVRFGEAAAD